MSRIDELIAQHCHAGVKYHTLGSIARLVRGNGMPKAMLTEEGVGAIHYGQIYTKYGAWTRSTHSFVTPEDAEKLAKANPGDIIITNTSENLEDVGKAVAWLGEAPIVTGGHATVIKHELDPKYLSYWFQSPSFFTQKRALASGTKVLDVSAKQLAKVRVPVPPLEVQREIVRILDQFTQLEAELEAELETRKRQFVSCRDRLMESKRIQRLCPNGLRRVRLGDLAQQYVAPVLVQPSESYTNLGVKWYGEGAFARKPKLGREIKAKTLYRVKAGQFIYNRMFVTEGSFGLVTPELEHGVVSNEFPVYELNLEQVIPEWLYLKFREPSIIKAVTAQATGGTKSRRRWKEEQFERFVVDLPPLPAQREIVRSLTKFSDLDHQLNAEIVARKAQYEHYLNRLLNFEEAAL